jgi:hypothetical protein
VRPTIHEPAVALTDLLVGLESIVFAVGLARRRPAGAAVDARTLERHYWLVASFAATGAAALFGAATHGLFPDREDPTRRRLWRLSLGSIGVAGLSAWRIGAATALHGRWGRRVSGAATLAHGAYLVGLTRTDPPFKVAIAAYLPGALFLSTAITSRLRFPAERRSAAIALVGMGLTFGGALAQVGRIAIHPRLFDHNATYHAIQATAAACFFAAAGGLVRGPQPVVRR